MSFLFLKMVYPSSLKCKAKVVNTRSYNIFIYFINRSNRQIDTFEIGSFHHLSSEKDGTQLVESFLDCSRVSASGM